MEAPGNFTFSVNNDCSVIRIEGIKLKDKETKDIENIFSTRKFGKFYLDIPIDSEKFHINNAPPKIYSKNGLIKIEYELGERDQLISLTEEDEI